jgi:hypothetical protein
MRKVEARMIEAIRDLIGNADYAGTYIKCGNTEVRQSHHGIAHTPGYQRIISVYLHGNEIAAIRPGENTLWVSDCGWQSVTTKSRLNALIGAFTHHYGITQRNGSWVQCEGKQAAYAWKGHDIFPFVLTDNTFLQRAEILAA